MISGLFTWICVQWFKLSGWTIPKNIPKELRTYVMAVAPHTSNVDFFVGVAARKIMKLDVKFMAKKELFKFPVRRLLLNLGGYPVDRSGNRKTSMVDYIVNIFEKTEPFAMCVAPEGTRSKVDSLKTGFYHIALKAGVPIVLVGFDYQKKTIEVADAFLPSGDIEKDMVSMFKFFSSITPKVPENFGLSLSKTL